MNLFNNNKVTITKKEYQDLLEKVKILHSYEYIQDHLFILYREAYKEYQEKLANKIDLEGVILQDEENKYAYLKNTKTFYIYNKVSDNKSYSTGYFKVFRPKGLVENLIIWTKLNHVPADIIKRMLEH